MATDLIQWSKQDRDDLLDLHQQHLEYSILKLSSLTGVPVEQIKFWLAATTWTPKTRKAETRPGATRAKFQDWESWRASTLRSRFRELGRKFPHAANPPSTGELLVWLRGLTMRCHWCKTPLTVKNFSVDHHHPVSRGGTSAIANLRQTCKRCNETKGSMTAWEFAALRLTVSTWLDGGKELFRRLRSGGGFMPRGHRTGSVPLPAVLDES